MLKKSKQGSNFQWNEGSGKYKMRECDQPKLQRCQSRDKV